MMALGHVLLMILHPESGSSNILVFNVATVKKPIPLQNLLKPPGKIPLTGLHMAFSYRDAHARIKHTIAKKAEL